MLLNPALLGLARLALVRLSNLEGRFYARADEADFKEHEHPREADGKFTSGAGAGGDKGYLGTLKGKKGSAAGLIKHMIMTGNHSESEIFNAAKKHYGLAEDKGHYVKWYHKDLQKSGSVPPPLLPGAKMSPHQKAKITDLAKKMGIEAPKAAVPNPADDELASFNSEGEPTSPAPKVDQPYAKLSDATKAKLDNVMDNLDKLLPHNKAEVEQKLGQINQALQLPTVAAQAAALAGVQPFPANQGMGKAGVNTYLQLAQNDYGAKGKKPELPAPPSANPKTAKAQKIYDKLAALPHAQNEHVHVLENHAGVEIKSRLKTSTKLIPGDFYAKVTAAYEGSLGNSVTQTVDSAMNAYADATYDARPHDQVHALGVYQDGGYKTINKTINTGEQPDDYTQKMIDSLDEAFKTAVVPADTPVFRGVNATLKNLTGFDDPEKAVGRCFEHKNYASCSRSQGTSSSFGSNVMLKFTIPAGTPGIVMKHQANEREIVLNRGSMFRIDKVESKGSGKLVHVTYLGTRDE